MILREKKIGKEKRKETEKLLVMKHLKNNKISTKQFGI